MHQVSSNTETNAAPRELTKPKAILRNARISILYLKTVLFSIFPLSNANFAMQDFLCTKDFAVTKKSKFTTLIFSNA